MDYLVDGWHCRHMPREPSIKLVYTSELFDVRVKFLLLLQTWPNVHLYCITSVSNTINVWKMLIVNKMDQMRSNWRNLRQVVMVNNDERWERWAAIRGIYQKCWQETKQNRYVKVLFNTINITLFNQY